MKGLTREEVAQCVGEEALFADGFDEALIGHVQRGASMVALYDANKCIEIMITRDGMTEEESREFFDYNVLGTWLGEMTPAFAWLSN